MKMPRGVVISQVLAGLKRMITDFTMILLRIDVLGYKSSFCFSGALGVPIIGIHMVLVVLGIESFKVLDLSFRSFFPSTRRNIPHTFLLVGRLSKKATVGGVDDWRASNRPGAKANKVEDRSCSMKSSLESTLTKIECL